MNKKKIVSTILLLSLIPNSAYGAKYTVQKGDTYWLISQKFNTTLKEVLKDNNKTDKSPLYVGDILNINSSTYTASKGDTYYLIAKKCNVSLDELLKLNGKTASSPLYVGDKIKIPTEKKTYTVQKGDTFWLISQKFGVKLDDLLKANNKTASNVLNIGDILIIPNGQSNVQNTNKNYITYGTYKVKKNDTLWSIAIDCKIPLDELLQANNLTQNSYIYEGMLLTYPIYHIAIKDTPSENHGELLDWFSEAQYVIPINTDFTIVDFETKKSFKARRTVGSGHADCEPLTANDTAIMKEIWGGNFNWNKRSILVISQGRKLAASMSGMLHAGNEGAPGGEWTSWRSDNYGAGTNYDYVKGNNAHGHFDLYFYNSIGHKNGVINEGHQSNIRKSAGK